ncbi:MAG: DUF368 domain-containing protein [Defluviitaleaceae bacterium]|nr:DUF368 domain-containing protein [Defluviitaleaceae bacterium]
MIINFIKGILIGLALVIPGLSASTFAVVTGLYDKLVFAVNNIRKEFKKSFFFLLPIALGAAVGILASVSAVIQVMYRFPLQSYAFFIGLVLGSLPTIFGKIKPEKSRKPNYLLAVFGFAIIVVLSLTVPTDDVVAVTQIENMGHFISIFAAGVISCFLLIVPGVSGALILILLGQFATVYGAVGNFAEMAFMLIRGQEGALELGFDAAMIVLTFLAGSIIGIIAAAKVIGYFFERYETKVYFAVLGLVLGAVFTLFHIDGIVIGYFTEFSPQILLNAGFLIVFAIVGYVCTKLMAKVKS